MPDDERRVPLDDADELDELPDEQLDEPSGTVVNTGDDQDPGDLGRTEPLAGRIELRSSDDETVWPLTLAASGAGLTALTALYGVIGARSGASPVVRFLFLVAIGAYVYGAWGIANEKKLGWQVAIAAALSPFALRFLDALFAFDFMSLSWKVRYTIGLEGGGILSAIFDAALVALLVHPMSRNHQRIWFT